MKLTVGRSIAIAALLFGFLVLATAALALLPVDRRVVVPGRFVYRSALPVVVGEAGFVTRVLAKEDSLVGEGQPILEIENEELVGDLRRSEALLGIHEIEMQQILQGESSGRATGALDVTQIEEELAFRKERLSYLETAVGHTRDLLAKNLGSRRSYEDAVLAHRAAQADVADLEIRIAQAAGRLAELDSTSRLRYDLKRREYAIEQDRLRQLRERVARLTVAAPADGRLLAEDLEGLLNRWVARGAAVGEVVSSDRIGFLGHARGADAVRLSEGQDVYFNVEVFRRRRFVRGTVTRIGFKATEGTGGFPVEIDVPDNRFFDRGRELFIQAGVPGEAVIITERGVSLVALVWEKVIDTLDVD